MKNKIFLLSVTFSCCLFMVGEVSAQSWWGDGVKSHEWILKHGGALIRFEIVNRSGEANEYKTILTRSGKKIEAEAGKQGIFDDAWPKKGKYKVTFYRGGDGQKSFSNTGKEIDSVTLDLHPGEMVNLKLDYSKKKISMRTDYREQEKEPEKKLTVSPKPRLIEKVPVENMNGIKKDEIENGEAREQQAMEEIPEGDGQENVWMASLENWGNRAVVSADICFSRNPKLAAYNASSFGFCGEELAQSEPVPDPAAHFQALPENATRTVDAFDFFQSLPSIFFRLNQYLGMNVLAQSGR